MKPVELQVVELPLAVLGFWLQIISGLCMVTGCSITEDVDLVCFCRVLIFFFCNPYTDHARVRAGLWDILGQEEAGSMAVRPGGLGESYLLQDDSEHVTHLSSVLTVGSLILARSGAQVKNMDSLKGPLYLL